MLKVYLAARLTSGFHLSVPGTVSMFEMCVCANGLLSHSGAGKQADELVTSQFMRWSKTGRSLHGQFLYIFLKWPHIVPLASTLVQNLKCSHCCYTLF